MKYKLPKEGSTRVIKKFALFPIVTSDNYRVWLDYYYVNQEYTIIREYDYSYFGWLPKYTSAYLDDPQLRNKIMQVSYQTLAQEYDKLQEKYKSLAEDYYDLHFEHEKLEEKYLNEVSLVKKLAEENAELKTKLYPFKS